MNKYKEIKDKLYQLMLATCEMDKDNGDTNISQSMGIAMTNAVKRGGVVNIISQNISFQKILPKVIEIMRDVDSLEHKPYEIEGEILQIEHMSDPVEECCKFFYDQGSEWKDFRDTMRTRYVEYVRRQCRSNNEASRFLNVHNSYVTKHIKETRDETSSRDV